MMKQSWQYTENHLFLVNNNRSRGLLIFQAQLDQTQRKANHSETAFSIHQKSADLKGTCPHHESWNPTSSSLTSKTTFKGNEGIIFNDDLTAYPVISAINSSHCESFGYCAVNNTVYRRYLVTKPQNPGLKLTGVSYLWVKSRLYTKVEVYMGI